MMDHKKEEAVWQRVMALSAQAPPCCEAKSEKTGKEQLAQLLDKGRETAAAYAALTCRVRGDGRRCILQLAKQAKGEVGKLEAVYYLMTGEKPRRDVPVGRPSAVCAGEALCRCYHAEAEGARCCRSLAEAGGDCSALLLDLAQEKTFRGKQLFWLLQRCM